MAKTRSVPRALRASSTARLDPPTLRTHGRQASRLFSVLEPRWWNELPLGNRTAESLAVFKRRLKTRLFVKHFSISTGPLFGQCLSSRRTLMLIPAGEGKHSTGSRWDTLAFSADKTHSGDRS
ncbi:hypothetical protein NFI96_023602 [Prochilodus magdalenae]|nr:hypothetical protein NFI96_023602 [Prochilodus magdalenae]